MVLLPNSLLDTSSFAVAQCPMLLLLLRVGVVPRGKQQRKETPCFFLQRTCIAMGNAMERNAMERNGTDDESSDWNAK